MGGAPGQLVAPSGAVQPSSDRRSATTLCAVRRALVLIVIMLVAVVLFVRGKDDSPAPDRTSTQRSASAGTTTVPRRSTRDGCRAVAAPEPRANRERRRSRKRLSRKRRHTAVIRTNCGTIEVRLDVRRAPKTTSSFAGLARNKFFDGLTFHRIARPGGNDYVIQGGDPLGDGNGGPGYTVVEPPPRNLKYRRYVVAMAKTETEQPGTSGSQFFIVTADETPLGPDYALLGRVVGGKSIVRRIAHVPIDATEETPIDPVVISSVRIRSSKRR
jgi:peptidyl-prolyl cis-trans isomerase B (cyclophilin B)